MTPELKTACEVVFQEHKGSTHPIKWNRDAFRGQISIGLSELAKETLVKKNIIILPNKSKKILTLLNPAVASATSFEEAAEMIGNSEHATVTSLAPDHIEYDPTEYIAHHVTGFDLPPAKYPAEVLLVDDRPASASNGIKWYMKPLFSYVVWPVCAAAAGALITFVIDLVSTN